EVVELAGLERALLALVETEIGAVTGPAAQRIGAAERFARRHALLAPVGRARHGLPDRQEQRGPHAVGFEREPHARIEPATQRHRAANVAARSRRGAPVAAAAPPPAAPCRDSCWCGWSAPGPCGRCARCRAAKSC